VSFDGMSDGRFTRLIQFQSGRFAEKGGFDAAMRLAPFREIADRLRIDSPLQWNLNEHKRAFLTMGPLNGNMWLLALAVGGQLFMSGARSARWGSRRLLITLWWAVPVFFSLFVWEPIWDHYCIVYLPPLAILGALCAYRLWDAPGFGRRVLAIVGVAGVMFLGTAYMSLRRVSYAEATRGPQAGETWLTFDPFVNFITRTTPACGIVDPMNVYGENSFGSTSNAKEFARFFIKPADLIACLEREPQTKIVFGYWSRWWVDQRLLDYVAALPPERRPPAPAFAWPLGLAAPPSSSQ
jgi:hypothetical protein